MIGIQARDTARPVVNQCTTKERRPLGDIDVNRSHHKIIPSKDVHHPGKGQIAPGFQVFADGETLTKKKDGMKISTKLAKTLDDVKRKMISGKKPFHSIDEMRNGEQLVTKDTCAVMKKPEVAIFNTGGVPKNGAQVTETEPLHAQFAWMSIEKSHNKTRHQVLRADVEHVIKAAANEIAISKDIDVMEEHGKSMCASLENISIKQAPKSATSASDTGAIRKIVQDTVRDKSHELPTFQLNVKAKEWNATSTNTTHETIADDTFASSTQLNGGARKLPSIWNLTLDEAQSNFAKQNGNTIGTHGNHDLPPIAQPHVGRKIVGRQLKPLEKRTVSRDIMRGLDDRTGEIERYERHKESLRKKATEAMRVEQERLKWSTQAGTVHQPQVRPNVPTDMKKQFQRPVVAATTNHTPTHTVAGIHGFQRTNSSNSSYASDQVQSLPLAEKTPAPVRSSICIMKHPTPPNVPIRYEPGELLNLNYAAKYGNKFADKRVKKILERARK